MNFDNGYAQSGDVLVRCFGITLPRERCTNNTKPRGARARLARVMLIAIRKCRRLPNLLLGCLSMAIVTLMMAATASDALGESGTSPTSAWQNLPSPKFVYPGDGAIYYSFEVQPKNASNQRLRKCRVHLVVVNLKSGRWTFRPLLNAVTLPTSVSSDREKASAAVNGGYFNLSDGLSTSYVVIDGHMVADPHSNADLTKNPKLIPFLPTVFNRSEIRFLKNRSGASMIQITAHNTPTPESWSLVHSLQAGPQLLPEITDRQEAFVRTDSKGQVVDAIGSKRSAARTAFGITSDGYAMLLCVSGAKQDPESTGMTLGETADLLRSLGCTQAINLDGGASTTMFVRLLSADQSQADNIPDGATVCAGKPETRVKSVLLLEHLK